MSAAFLKDVPMADYLALDAVSSSLLHELATKTPAHARLYMTQPREDTVALLVGEAAHYAILEPDRFDERYACPPDVDRRTKIGRAAYEAWTAEHADKVPLKFDEYESAVAIMRAVRANAEVMRYLVGAGINEGTILWQEDQCECKARPDRVTVVDGYTFILDIKTCRSASPYGFGKAVAEYGYHRKAAWYLDAANRVEERERQFVFLAVESKPPHAMALYELTDDAIGQGREDNRAALATYRECLESGRWPGYAPGISYLDLPAWAQRVTA